MPFEGLKPAAFEVPEPSMDTFDLAGIYGNNVPIVREYERKTDDIDGNEKDFQEQTHVLLNHFIELSKVLYSDESEETQKNAIIQSLENFKSHLFDKDITGNQTNRYFSDVKIQLERIFCQLNSIHAKYKQNLSEENKIHLNNIKKDFYNFCQELIFCGPAIGKKNRGILQKN